MIVLDLSDAERVLLRTLLDQYEEIVHDDSGDDAAVDRLFPTAYRDDAEAAAEFARYTRTGLVDHKTANAGAVAASLAGSGLIELDSSEAARWLPVLTDLRLILAERIGIAADDDEVPDDDLGRVYHWLAQLQSYLIDALDALDGAGEAAGVDS